MADYKAKKEAALKRLEMLDADTKRVAKKIEDTKALIAECDRMLALEAEQSEKK